MARTRHTAEQVALKMPQKAGQDGKQSEFEEKMFLYF